MTLKDQGFKFPAEWEAHKSVWLTFPHNTETWEDRLTKILPSYFSFIKEVSSSEYVNIISKDNAHSIFITEGLSKYGINESDVSLHSFGSNDSWCRDHGPSFVVNKNTKERRIVNWGYNAWGGKYPPFNLDNEIPIKVAKELNLPYISTGVVMEGGSIEVNETGDLLTTKSCLLNKNRNPHLNQKEIEKLLIENYGVEKVHWLEDGIVGDDTDGHIDDTIRFVNNNTVIAAIEHSKKDANFKPLKENIELLRKLELNNGDSLNIVELPMPSPVISEGTRLPASYANFYISNDKVIVPIFKDNKDDLALSIIQDYFTDRTVVGIDSREIIWGLGSFHCLSQQEPDS